MNAMSIHEEIFKFNRYPNISDWFIEQLTELIAFGIYHNDIETLRDSIIQDLVLYKEVYNISNVVVGMSGGIDSAVTASLFKAAGYEVHGVTMPIHQKPEETDRGIEACEKLSIVHHHKDLTRLYEKYCEVHAETDLSLLSNPIRCGNVKARLRMITLYDLASKLKGFVASTDNFSELAAGFWTLHGDVGDVSPIQSLTKSWEIPSLAEKLRVPNSIIEAVPTDGLGIANGDEDQFGFSYLEFDITLFKLMRGGIDLNNLDTTDKDIVTNIINRVRGSSFKRKNPYNIVHPLDTVRYRDLTVLDNYLWSDNNG